MTQIAEQMRIYLRGLEVLLPAGTHSEDIQRSGFVDTSPTPGYPA